MASGHTDERGGMSSAGESRYSLKAPLSSNFLDQHFEADRVRPSPFHMPSLLSTDGEHGHAVRVLAGEGALLLPATEREQQACMFPRLPN